jgi:hypothetical protein
LSTQSDRTLTQGTVLIVFAEVILLYFALLPVVNGLVVIGSPLPLDSGYYATSAVVDSANGFAYFGLEPQNEAWPGRIAKIGLRGFEQAASLSLYSEMWLPIEDGFPSSAIVDSAGGFAYFGTIGRGPTDHGAIVKVRLSNFTQVAALPLDQGEGVLAGVIDAQFAYFGTQPNGRIVRISLSNFTESGSLTLGAGKEVIVSATIDPINGFAYFGTIKKGGSSEPGKIVKVRLSDFTKVDELSLDQGEQNALSASADPVHGFAYFGTRVAVGSNYATRIVKLRLADFKRVGSLTLNLTDNFVTAVVDSTREFAYFGGTAGSVVAVRLSDFSLYDSLSLGVGVSCAVTDPSSDLLYLGTQTAPTTVVVVEPTAVVTTTATINLPSTVTSVLTVTDEYTTTTTQSATSTITSGATSTSLTSTVFTSSYFTILANQEGEVATLLLVAVALASLFLPRLRAMKMRGPRLCPQCGFENPPYGGSFCVRCGNKLKD